MTKTRPRSETADGDSAKIAYHPAYRPPADESEPMLPGMFEQDSYASTAIPEILDRAVHAAAAQATGGLSPTALAGAYLDWAVHLATSPGKQIQLGQKALKKWLRLTTYAAQCRPDGPSPAPCIDPLPQDRRFDGEQWQRWPFNLIYQSFLLNQQWWHNATTGVRGVTAQHERVVEFATRQMLDVFSPSNFIATNPEVLERTRQEGGMNLIRGFENFLEDWQRTLSRGKPPGTEEFNVGDDVAVTPGKVIYRNRLMELIQYEPTGGRVRPEPILIVPAWIMKYYILDLSWHNSLVRYLTEQGFTVFMVSWINPGPEDRDLGMEDYREMGVLDALKAVNAIVPDRKVHGVGYCLGGTLLAIAAAAMARDSDERFASLTFLAAQVDFKEAGELTLFINESQLTFLEDMMWEQGFLDTTQMAGAFQLLRSNDLVWSRIEREYLMGERQPMIDLMAWNADQTRMPYRMHSEYLRRLFLDNELAEGRFTVDDRPVMVSDIRAPMFVLGTVKDHVAPWRSVYKMLHLTDTDVTFVLTSGGHNAGVISEPGHPRRQYQVATRHDHDRFVDPDTWAAETPANEGSWWPEWSGWLEQFSGAPVKSPRTGAPEAGCPVICDAPGRYVLMP